RHRRPTLFFIGFIGVWRTRLQQVRLRCKLNRSRCVRFARYAMDAQPFDVFRYLVGRKAASCIARDIGFLSQDTHRIPSSAQAVSTGMECDLSLCCQPGGPLGTYQQCAICNHGKQT
ncbi:MAG TPA: hypothetical protein VIV60_20450, partial [Polyangiaceae bacterium]